MSHSDQPAPSAEREVNGAKADVNAGRRAGEATGKGAVDPETSEANEAMRAWLQQSLTASREQLSVPNLLPGVQRRIRRRSRGRFFADGWSTATLQTTPVVLAVLTLGLIALAYYAMVPWPVR